MISPLCVRFTSGLFLVVFFLALIFQLAADDVNRFLLRQRVLFVFVTGEKEWRRKTLTKDLQFTCKLSLLRSLCSFLFLFFIRLRLVSLVVTNAHAYAFNYH